MAVKSVLNKDIYKTNLAGTGDGYGSVTKVKPTTGGTYADGLAALTPNMPKVPTSTVKPNLGITPINGLGGGAIGGVSKEGAVTGGLGVTKLPTIANGTTKKSATYTNYLSMVQAKTMPQTAKADQSTQATIAPTAQQAQRAQSAPATQAEKASETPASYEEYLQQQRELLDKRKADADRQAEAAKERAAVDAQASYAQNMATYGTNAETLAQMGLQGGGYSDYLNAQAYAQKRADVQQANVTEQAAKVQNNATYEDALSELNKSELEYKERQQEKADAEAKEQKDKQDSIYASLWERAIDPDSNYTEANIESLGREYGLPDSQIEELKKVIRESKTERNGNIYANLLGYANDGSYFPEQIEAIAREKGLSAQQVSELKAAATTYKQNVYKTNYSSLMSSIDSGSMSKNTLDTALENDTITQEQYNTLLNKYQAGNYDEYSAEITSSLYAFVNSNTTGYIDQALQRGEISQAQYDELKKKFNDTIKGGIDSATLFYQSGMLDEDSAKDMVQKLKNSGWLSDENNGQIDSFLSGQYKEEDDGGCYAKGTLITVADGSQVPVENLKEGDNILVFNHYTGELDIAPILFMYYEGKKKYDVLKLHFGEAADIEVLYGHGFFDVDLNKYVLIKSANVKDYIGHRFWQIKNKNGGNKVEIVSLTGYEEYKAETECYCAVSTKHLNSVANGILTMPDDQNKPPQDVIGFCNLFELDENHKFDVAKMAADIEAYGIFSYEDFCQMVPDHTDIGDLFFGIGGEYINVAFGKGLLSMEKLSTFIGIGADHREEQNTHRSE